MGSVRTPIIGRPRPLSSDRRAGPDYTLICDEPDKRERPCRAVIVAADKRKVYRDVRVRLAVSWSIWAAAVRRESATPASIMCW